MVITEVRTILTCPGRNYVLVKVCTDEGIYGVGDGTLNGSELAVAQAIESMSPLLIGRDPHRIEDAWQFMYRHTYWRGGAVFAAAISAIDLALWDIKGKLANMPVYQLLGGKARDGVMCYGHAGGRDPVEVEDSVRRFIDEGYRAVRAQIGDYGGPGLIRHDPPPREGLPSTGIFEPTPYILSVPKLFEHLRTALGDEVELLHDVHEKLDPISAARLAKSLEPYRLFFLEDPLQPEHRESWPLVRSASTTPLAMGELFTSRWDCLPLFMNRWIDYIRIAPIHVGGITEARKICVLAEPFNVKTAFHGAADISPIGQAAAVHLSIAVSNFGILEWVSFPDVVHQVMPGGCIFRDGYAYPLESPGLGVDINEAEAEKHPYQRAFMPIVRRLDGTMHVY
ncbi:MAG: D-galactonate dehydratase family protein [Armatimonadota bacterium]